VNNPPPNTPAERQLENFESSDFLSYEELLMTLATSTDSFSGAALAGIARAAASRALERAVGQFSVEDESAEISSIMNCLVTQDDFYEAVDDVRGSMGTHDHSED